MAKISIVIASYNDRPSLEGCLVSLDHQRPGSHEFDVVVVDDGSDDGTAEMVQALQPTYTLSYIHKPRTADSGRSAARNTGIRAARGDIVVMVDADQIIPPEFVARHADAHEYDPNLVVLGPRPYFRSGTVDVARLRRGFGNGVL